MKRKTNCKRIVSIFTLFTLLLTLALSPTIVPPIKAAPFIIRVPKDCSTIQEAIDAAGARDTIQVAPGTYHENLVISKSVSLIGENAATTIIDGSETKDHVVYIGYTNNVVFSGFTVQGSWGDPLQSPTYVGIRLSGAENCTISDNIITGNWYGLELEGTYNRLFNNTIINNQKGVFIKGRFNVLRDNNITHNSLWNFGAYGPQFIDTSNKVDEKPIYYLVNEHDKRIPDDAGYVGVVNSERIVVKNIDIKNNFYGIQFTDTTHSLIENVTIRNCPYGILLGGSYNEIRFNNISGSLFARDIGMSDTGIGIGGDWNIVSENIVSFYFEGVIISGYKNTISKNVIKNSRYGISLNGIYVRYNLVENNLVENSSNSGIGLGNGPAYNKVVGNTVIGSKGMGIGLDRGYKNEIYRNNFIDNEVQAYFSEFGSQDIWDNGYEGNYWSDYTGKDFDKDGIGDTFLPHQGVDWHPLVNPWTPLTPLPEVLLSISTFKDQVPIISNVTLCDEGLTTIEAKHGVSSYDWVLPSGTYHVNASIFYNDHVYDSDQIKVSLMGYTKLSISFQFGNMTVSCVDDEQRPLENCTIVFTREDEERVRNSDGLGLATLEAYYGEWMVDTYWMGVPVGGINVTVDTPDTQVKIKCGVGDFTVIAIDEKGEFIKANFTLANETYGLCFSGCLDGVIENHTFTKIPLIDYKLTIRNGFETHTYSLDTSRAREIKIEIIVKPFLETPLGMATMGGLMVLGVILAVSILRVRGKS